MKANSHGMLVAMFSTTLLTLMLLLAIPAEAQNTADQYASPKEAPQEVDGSRQKAPAATAGEDDSQAAARAVDTLVDGQVQIIDSDDSDTTVNQVVISDVDCTGEEQGASIVVEDDDGTQVELTDGGNVDISSSERRIVAQGSLDGNLRGITPTAPGNDSNFGDPRSDEYTETGEVIDSTGITCGREAGSNDAGDDNNASDTGDGNDARTAEELQDLSCEELLVLFRAGGSSSGQYGDADALTEPDVQARIEVCLEEEIVEGTAADGDLPDTGGVSLVGLAVLGIVSAAAGLSVIRGGRRDR